MLKEIFYYTIICLTLLTCLGLEVKFEVERKDDFTNQQDVLFSNNVETKYQISRILEKDLVKKSEKESKLKYFKKVLESVYKFKKPTERPKASHQWLYKSWGAGGMPFNVLYTPNSNQQKILKSQKKFPSVLEEKSEVFKDSLKKQLLRVYDQISDKKIRKTNEKNLKKHFVPRKYYSLIPQLFVSYGW